VYLIEHGHSKAEKHRRLTNVGREFEDEGSRSLGLWGGQEGGEED